MSNPNEVRYLKSSGGDVDTEFYGSDAVCREFTDICQMESLPAYIVDAGLRIRIKPLIQEDPVWHLVHQVPVDCHSVFISGLVKVLSAKDAVGNLFAYDENRGYIDTLLNASSEQVYNDYEIELPQKTKYISYVYWDDGEQVGDKIPHLYAKVSPEARIEDKTVTGGKVTFGSIDPDATQYIRRANGNMINFRAIEMGYYYNWITGQRIEAASSYGTTPYIEVKPGHNYYLSHCNQVAMYDDKLAYVGGMYMLDVDGDGIIMHTLGFMTGDHIIKNDGNQTGKVVFTVPDCARYITCAVSNSWSYIQLEESDDYLDREDYAVKFICDVYGVGGLINESYQHVRDVIAPVITGNTRVKLIGDSITAGVGGSGYDVSASGGGVLLWNNRYTNVKGTCWANSLKDYWENKYGCTVLNYGYSGIKSQDILDHMSTLVEDEDDIVVCMIGTNDRNEEYEGELSDFIGRMQQIIDTVQSMGKKIVVMANIPASVSNEVDTPRKFHMEDVDNAISYAASTRNMDYVSVYKLFVNYCNTNNVEIDSLLGDGLHPNDDGYAVMFDLISNALGIATKRPRASW